MVWSTYIQGPYKDLDLHTGLPDFYFYSTYTQTGKNKVNEHT
jgi:hypothetical protein